MACAVAALNGPVQAQARPEQPPSPNPTPFSPVVAKQRIESDTKPQLFGHRPIIDIVLVYTNPGFDIVQRQLRHYDPFDVGGPVKILITRALSFSFDRDVDGTVNVTRSAILVERLDYQISRLTIEGGLSYRHRIDADSGVSTGVFPKTVSSAEWRYGYVGLTHTTVPIRVGQQRLR